MSTGATNSVTMNAWSKPLTKPVVGVTAPVVPSSNTAATSNSNNAASVTSGTGGSSTSFRNNTNTNATGGGGGGGQHYNNSNHNNNNNNTGTRYGNHHTKYHRSGSGGSGGHNNNNNNNNNNNASTQSHSHSQQYQHYKQQYSNNNNHNNNHYSNKSNNQQHHNNNKSSNSNSTIHNHMTTNQIEKMILPALRERYLHLLTLLIGQKVTITLLQDAPTTIYYTGILHTVTPFTQQQLLSSSSSQQQQSSSSLQQQRMKYVLRAVTTTTSSSNGSNGDSATTAAPSTATTKVQSGSTVLFDIDQVVQLHCKSIRFDTLAGGNQSNLHTAANSSDAFTTDTEISRSSAGSMNNNNKATSTRQSLNHQSKDLVAVDASWTSGGAENSALQPPSTPTTINSKAAKLAGIHLSGNAPLQQQNNNSGLSGSIAGWDQFKANEELFNVKSSYDETIYTTVLDHKQITDKDRKRAEQLAYEIEHTTSTNIHIAEERNQISETDYAQLGDEEDRYSGVLKSNTTITIQSTTDEEKASLSLSKLNYAQAVAKADGVTATTVVSGAPPPGFVSTATTNASGKDKDNINPTATKTNETSVVVTKDKVASVNGDTPIQNTAYVDTNITGMDQMSTSALDNVTSAAVVEGAAETKKDEIIDNSNDIKEVAPVATTSDDTASTSTTTAPATRPPIKSSLSATAKSFSLNINAKTFQPTIPQMQSQQSIPPPPPPPPPPLPHQQHTQHQQPHHYQHHNQHHLHQQQQHHQQHHHATAVPQYMFDAATGAPMMIPPVVGPHHHMMPGGMMPPMMNAQYPGMRYVGQYPGMDYAQPPMSHVPIPVMQHPHQPIPVPVPHQQLPSTTTSTATTTSATTSNVTSPVPSEDVAASGTIVEDGSSVVPPSSQKHVEASDTGIDAAATVGDTSEQQQPSSSPANTTEMASTAVPVVTPQHRSSQQHHLQHHPPQHYQNTPAIPGPHMYYPGTYYNPTAMGMYPPQPIPTHGGQVGGGPPQQQYGNQHQQHMIQHQRQPMYGGPNVGGIPNNSAVPPNMMRAGGPPQPAFYHGPNGPVPYPQYSNIGGNYGIGGSVGADDDTNSSINGNSTNHNNNMNGYVRGGGGRGGRGQSGGRGGRNTGGRGQGRGNNANNNMNSNTNIGGGRSGGRGGGGRYNHQYSGGSLSDTNSGRATPLENNVQLPQQQQQQTTTSQLSKGQQDMNTFNNNGQPSLPALPDPTTSTANTNDVGSKPSGDSEITTSVQASTPATDSTPLSGTSTVTESA